MTLIHRPEHRIQSATINASVAHIHFANEAGLEAFRRDNRAQIRQEHVIWNYDFEPILTFTAKPN